MGLFMVWGFVGYFLAVPATFAAVLDAQSPPQKVEGFAQHAFLYGMVVSVAFVVAWVASRGRAFVWWLVGARAVALVAVATLVVGWVEPRVAEASPNARGLAAALAAGAAGFVFWAVVRWWDRNRRHRPVAGQIWLARVPFREGGGALPHYCVVLRARWRYAEVLQITTKNKDHRDDHIRIPNQGWDHVSGRDHWVEIGLPPRLVAYQDFEKARPPGPLPPRHLAPPPRRTAFLTSSWTTDDDRR
ncbi:hypothetical protein [Streptomyces sp. CC208A]|uniref:hypothetical protein n=1 Tax=Streptomyces sp. CC208A TaxID=3044573 RepID=UPI0024A7CE90|nr:hypothetical protein [Streptomyces sp. CC208A]